MKQFEYPLAPNNDAEIRDHEFEIDLKNTKKRIERSCFALI